MYKRIYDKTFLLPLNSKANQLALLAEKAKDIDSSMELLLQTENNIPVLPISPKKVSELPRHHRKRKNKD